MNKKSLIISILLVFILTTSAVNFTEAQVPKVPEPTCVPVPGIPCPGESNDVGLPLDSPRKACQYYQNRWEKGLILVVKNTENECLVRVGDSNAGFGYIRGYYSGNKFCLDSYGAYFNNAGLSDSSECISVSQIGKVQQQKTSPKIVTSAPSNIEKNIKQLFDYLATNINKIINDIKGGFQNIFDGLRKIKDYFL